MGPYEVVKVISQVAYHLQLPAALAHLYDVFHILLLKPHHGAVLYHANPVVVDTTAAAPEYEVETILHSRQCQYNWHQCVEYLVKWKDYLIQEVTWESADHLVNA